MLVSCDSPNQAPNITLTEFLPSVALRESAVARCCQQQRHRPQRLKQSPATHLSTHRALHLMSTQALTPVNIQVKCDRHSQVKSLVQYQANLEQEAFGQSQRWPLPSLCQQRHQPNPDNHPDGYNQREFVIQAQSLSSSGVPVLMETMTEPPEFRTT